MADDWTDKLSDYLDGELNEADKGSLEVHLSECEKCRTALEGLRVVVSDAAALEDRAPVSDLWTGIEARIKQGEPSRAEVIEIGRPVKSRRRISFTVPQLVAAGIALMAVSVGSVWVAMSDTNGADNTRMFGTNGQGEEMVVLAGFDDPGYDAAVAELERVLEKERGRLDPATVEVLERSLETIDEAIAEARAALTADPGNSYLNEHLSATMNQKVRLLRQAVKLATAAS